MKNLLGEGVGVTLKELKFSPASGNQLQARSIQTFFSSGHSNTNKCGKGVKNLVVFYRPLHRIIYFFHLYKPEIFFRKVSPPPKIK